MKFNVPADFCDLATDLKSSILKSAETAFKDNKKVYYAEKHFTNFDELKSFLTDRCKAVEAEHDWPGERLDN